MSMTIYGIYQNLPLYCDKVKQIAFNKIDFYKKVFVRKIKYELSLSLSLCPYVSSSVCVLERERERDLTDKPNRNRNRIESESGKDGTQFFFC